MVGPCLGELGRAVGRQVQRRTALRHRSEDPMTTEELLAAILAVLQRIERIQSFTMKAEVVGFDEPLADRTLEVEPSPPISE